MQSVLVFQEKSFDSVELSRRDNCPTFCGIAVTLQGVRRGSNAVELLIQNAEGERQAIRYPNVQFKAEAPVARAIDKGLGARKTPTRGKALGLEGMKNRPSLVPLFQQ